MTKLFCAFNLDATVRVAADDENDFQAVAIVAEGLGSPWDSTMVHQRAMLTSHRKTPTLIGDPANSVFGSAAHDCARLRTTFKGDLS